jgi:hypothetical protein
MDVGENERFAKKAVSEKLRESRKIIKFLS